MILFLVHWNLGPASRDVRPRCFLLGCLMWRMQLGLHGLHGLHALLAGRPDLGIL